MDAKLASRLDELEARAIAALSDEELEELTSGEYAWMHELTDAELDSLIAGGPISPRVAALMMKNS